MKFLAKNQTVNLTTAQRNALPNLQAGMQIWNVDTNIFEHWTGVGWVPSDTTGSSGGNTLISLIDTPIGYGSAGDLLMTNASGDGTAWVNQSSITGSGGGSCGCGCNGTFKGLSDTPVDYTSSNVGDILVINSTKTGLIFTAPPSGGGGGGATNLISLTDTPNTMGASTQILQVNGAGTALEWVNKPSSAPTTLISLTDTPNAFGATGQMLVVNGAGDGMIWSSPPSGGGGGATNFLNLTDTPATFGITGQVPSINAAGNALEWTTPASGGVNDLISLTDTPAAYGTAGQLLAINATTNGVEWVNSPSGGGGGSTTVVGLTDTPAFYGNTGEVLVVNANEDGFDYTTITGGVSTFLGLADTPSTYAGNGDKFLRVIAGSGGSPDRVVFGDMDQPNVSLDSLTDVGGYGASAQVLAMNSAGNSVEWVDALSTSTKRKGGFIAYNQGLVETNTRVFLEILSEHILFSIGAPNSVFYTVTPPTATTIFTIFKEDQGNFGTPVAIGTVEFPANNQDGNLTFGGFQSLFSGDMIYVQSPATTNGMKDFFFNLSGEVDLWVST